MDLEKAQIVKEAEKIENLNLEGFKEKLYDFQEKGVLWMYLAGRCLLADSCGLGKTIQSLGLTCLLKSVKKIKRSLFCVPNSSLDQWYKEILKFTNLSVVKVGGQTKFERGLIYTACMPYDIYLVTHSLIHRDLNYLLGLESDLFVLDEGSLIKNHDTKAAESVKIISERTERVIIMSATPVQNDLTDLHSIFEAIDKSLLGNRWRFLNKYCVRESRFIKVWNPRKRRKELREFKVIVGSKNLDDLKQKVYPFYLRRRIQDVDNCLPDVIVRDVWLDLYKKQREVYKGLEEETVQLWHDGKIKEVKKHLHTVQQCVDGLASLGRDLPDISSKLDYLVDLISGDLCEDKVIVYSTYKNTLKTLTSRLTIKNIQSITISGDVSQEQRGISIKNFREENDVKVCMGTIAMEMSLNLQVAGHMILIDRLYNPERMEQLVGRMRRLGSKFKTVVVINLLTVNTMEQRIYNYIRRKKALPDYLFDEQSDIFERLPEDELKEVLGLK